MGSLTTEEPESRDYCQYCEGACEEAYSHSPQTRALFLYPAQPRTIAATIEAAAERLKSDRPNETWKTWHDLRGEGQVVFCEICRAIRSAGTVVADITTLNFNLLFEIGFAMGSAVPVVPIRDTSYGLPEKSFSALGILDTLKYLDFANAQDLARILLGRIPGTTVPPAPLRVYSDSPIYFLKGPIETEGAVRLLSVLKKSPLRFRTYDPRDAAIIASCCT